MFSPLPREHRPSHQRRRRMSHGVDRRHRNARDISQAATASLPPAFFFPFIFFSFLRLDYSIGLLLPLHHAAARELTKPHPPPRRKTTAPHLRTTGGARRSCGWRRDEPAPRRRPVGDARGAAPANPDPAPDCAQAQRITQPNPPTRGRARAYRSPARPYALDPSRVHSLSTRVCVRAWPGFLVLSVPSVYDLRRRPGTRGCACALHRGMHLLPCRQPIFIHPG